MAQDVLNTVLTRSGSLNPLKLSSNKIQSFACEFYIVTIHILASSESFQWNFLVFEVKE